jgi:hypothetical protein
MAETVEIGPSQTLELTEIQATIDHVKEMSEEITHELTVNAGLLERTEAISEENSWKMMTGREKIRALAALASYHCLLLTIAVLAVGLAVLVWL